MADTAYTASTATLTAQLITSLPAPSNGSRDHCSCNLNEQCSYSIHSQPRFNGTGDFFLEHWPEQAFDDNIYATSIMHKRALDFHEWYIRHHNLHPVSGRSQLLPTRFRASRFVLTGRLPNQLLRRCAIPRCARGSNINLLSQARQKSLILYRKELINSNSGMSFLQNASSCAQILPLETAIGTPVVIANLTSQYTKQFTAFAPTILVAWASSDLASFTPASAPLLQIIITTSTRVAGSDTPTGLTAGAKAGIGVGAALGLIACVALGIWLLIRRRRSRAVAQFASKDDSNDKAELPGQSVEKKRPEATELGPNGEIFETSGYGLPAELEPHARYELEGGFHGYEAAAVRSPIR
ncbi:hypothetical protein LTS10_000024 [Elasticomyces elasticus]|nr:hypothetical protein LTS10_000024 [Elasticomyces elasticus]